MEPERLERIKKAILDSENAVRAAREELERARRAGFDVAEREARLVELENRVAMAKRVYIEGG